MCACNARHRLSRTNNDVDLIDGSLWQWFRTNYAKMKMHHNRSMHFRLVFQVVAIAFTIELTEGRTAMLNCINVTTKYFVFFCRPVKQKRTSGHDWITFGDNWIVRWMRSFFSSSYSITCTLTPKIQRINGLFMIDDKERRLNRFDGDFRVDSFIKILTTKMNGFSWVANRQYSLLFCVSFCRCWMRPWCFIMCRQVCFMNDFSIEFLWCHWLRFVIVNIIVKLRHHHTFGRLYFNPCLHVPILCLIHFDVSKMNFTSIRMKAHSIDGNTWKSSIMSILPNETTTRDHHQLIISLITEHIYA